MVVLSLRCCPGFSLVPASRSYSLAAVLGFRVLQFPWSGARAPGLSGSSSRSTWAQQLRLAGSRHGLTRSAARGIFQHRGSTPCLLHRQAHSLPLSRSEGATSRWWALSAQPSPRPTHSPAPARSQPPPTGAGSAGRAPPDGVRRGAAHGPAARGTRLRRSRGLPGRQESAPQASPGWPSAMHAGQQGYAHSTTSLLWVQGEKAFVCWSLSFQFPKPTDMGSPS